MELIKSKHAEVLAPCGSFECVKAAINGMADAVYLGYGEFNARRNAENFTFDTLCEAVSLCHSHNVKVYLTLNTLVFPEEIPAALRVAQDGARAQVDGLILQDTGLASLIKKALPDMPLHASTQLSVHSLSGAKLLYEAGFSRVVLAREMSEREIREIHEALPDLELEYFVHGALCMSVSGQCYFSAFLGSRSGNRGLCAQTCRLPFELKNNSHALSLKDLSLVSRVSALVDAGVTSLKIEGRMKRPEYVAIASRTVKLALLEKDFSDENALLSRVFSRSGFTDGYFENNRNEDMFGTRRKEDAEGSAEAFSRINQLTRNPVPSLPVDLFLSVKENGPLSLRCVDVENKSEVTVTGDIPERAKNPFDVSKLISALEKTGNSAYFPRVTETDADGSLFVPVSTVNGLRREGLDRLISLRFEEKKVPDFTLPSFEKGERDLTEKYIIRCEDLEGLPENIPEKSTVILPLSAMADREKVAVLVKKGYSLCAELPRLIFSKNAEEKAVRELKDARALGVTSVLCSNIGHILLAKDAKMEIFGGFGLNITNPYSYEFYKNYGMEKTLLSFELTLKQISGFASKNHALFCYGRVPVMLTRACPNMGKKGCADCKKGEFLTDRMGERFPLLCRKGYCEILNSRPLYMGDRKNELLNAGISSFLLWFTKETKEEAEEVVDSFILGKPYGDEFTRGLYYRKEK